MKQIELNSDQSVEIVVPFGTRFAPLRITPDRKSVSWRIERQWDNSSEWIEWCDIPAQISQEWRGSRGLQIRGLAEVEVALQQVANRINSTLDIDGAVRVESKPSEVDTPAKYLSATEVASLLGVSRSTIYQLRRSGALKFVRLGSTVRFDRDDIEKYVDSLKR